MKAVQIHGQVYNLQTQKNYDATLTIDKNERGIITKINIPNIKNDILENGASGKTILKSLDLLTFFMSNLGLFLSGVNHEDIFSIEEKKTRELIIKLLNSGRLNYNNQFVRSEADRVFMEEYQSIKGLDFDFGDINNIAEEIQALFAIGRYSVENAQDYLFSAYYFSIKQEPFTSFSYLHTKQLKKQSFKIFSDNIISLHHRIINYDFSQSLRNLVFKTIAENQEINSSDLS